MAFEALAAIGTYVMEGLYGAGLAGSAYAGAGAAAEGAASAYAAGAVSTAGAASAATYASYASLASAALATTSAMQSSQNQAASADYNARMGVANAQQASMQAGAAEDAQRRQSAVILGEQRAAFAGSGVDPSSGSGLLVQQQSARNAELDALQVRYQGLLQGRGLLAQSELDARQASIYRQNAAIAGVSGAFSTLGSVAAGRGNYLRLRNYRGGNALTGEY